MPVNRLIVDTDAGVDDAIALMMALGRPEVEIMAITTVSGNVEVAKVNRNVALTLDAMNKDVPIYAGCERALMGSLETVSGLMGQDGLGNASLTLPPSRRQPQPEHAALALIRLVSEASRQGPFTLLTLGPLTNLALAVRLDPSLVERVPRLVSMGGTLYAQGNTSAAAEFNIYADPEAAAVVFSAGFENHWLLPWETSTTQLMLWPEYEALVQMGTPRAAFFQQITGQLIEAMRDVFGLPGLPLPDPLAMAIALDESVAVEYRSTYAAVEIEGKLGRGFTSMEGHQPRHKPNVRLVSRVDLAAVQSMLHSALL
jgi:purine nucleosidase